jgi:DNA-binding response OmpR family regulator
MGAKVLIIEDDAAIRRGLELNLSTEGHEVVAAGTGEAGLEAAATCPPDLVILDIMLPGRSGLSVCESLRRDGHLMPIILLSALGAEEDVVRGLEAGADDYVVKPFRLQELLARVRARLRRAQPGDVHRFGDVVVDLDRYHVSRDGETVDLSKTEFDLLKFLVERPGDVLTRDMILQEVWGVGYQGTDRTVDNFINRLRQKLDVLGTPRYFRTVRGVGYRFEPEER